MVKGLFAFISRLFLNKKTDDFNVDVCIFGLGNPGNDYAKNRHNIGFRVVDAYLECLKVTNTVITETFELTTGVTSGKKTVAIVKPLTFMNKSGEVVGSVVNKLSSIDSRFLVIVDDFNIPLGELRTKNAGTHGGHNGLKSIISYIGSEFPRLRVGIGPLPEKQSVIDFVLGNFSEEEEQKLISVISETKNAMTLFIDQNIDAVMRCYN